MHPKTNLAYVVAPFATIAKNLREMVWVFWQMHVKLREAGHWGKAAMHAITPHFHFDRRITRCQH